MKMKKKVTAVLEKLKLSSMIFLEIMKGGNTMIVKYLAVTILDGLMTLEEIKNKKLRKLVKAELDKMGLAEVVEEDKQ
uniref:Uncharacterized protein n=1 Tax=Siphoviridae sp. ctyQ43 TaxID=2823612 RepID=A0A8S5L962_9CAUD|nr:MAG TPA: hypothetical protein [Siphoviridae sp. ctyQ43]